MSMAPPLPKSRSIPPNRNARKNPSSIMAITIAATTALEARIAISRYGIEWLGPIYAAIPNRVPTATSASSSPAPTRTRLPRGRAKPARNSSASRSGRAKHKSATSSVTITVRSKILGNGKWKPAAATPAAANGAMITAAARPRASARTNFRVKDIRVGANFRGRVVSPTRSARAAQRIALWFEHDLQRTCSFGRVDDAHHGGGDIGRLEHQGALEALVMRNQRRIDQPWNYNRRANPLLAEFGETCMGERDQPCLGRRVDRLAGRKVARGRRGDIDDRAARLLFRHLRRREARERDRRAQVDREHPVLVLGAGLHERRARRSPSGVIDQHVDSSEMVERRAD